MPKALIVFSDELYEALKKVCGDRKMKRSQLIEQVLRRELNLPNIFSVGGKKI